MADGDAIDQLSEQMDIEEGDGDRDADAMEADSPEQETLEFEDTDTTDPDADGDYGEEEQFTDTEEQEYAENDTPESDTEPVPESCLKETLRINARKLRDVVSAAPYGLVAMSGDVCAAINIANPDNSLRYVDIPATWLHQASPGYVTAGTPNVVRRYALGTLNETPAPVAELRDIGDRSCPGGDRLYWLYGDDTGIRVTSARLEADGGITNGGASDVLPLPQTTPWNSYHTLLGCGTGPVITIADQKEKISMMPTGAFLEWKLIALDAGNLSAFGVPQVLWEGEIYGLEGVSGWIRTLFNGDRMLAEGDFYGVLGWTSPANHDAHRFMYDCSDPTHVTRQQEHPVNLYKTRVWQHDSLWSIEGTSIVRYDFSDQTTPVETSRFEVNAAVAAMDIQGDRAFIAVAQYGLIVVDMPPNATPSVLIDQRLTLPMSKTGAMLHHREKLWVLADNRRLLVPDIAHPDSYTPLVRHDLHISGSQVISSGDRILVVGYDADTLPLEIIETQDLSQPERLFSGGVDRPGSMSRGYRGYASVADNILFVGQRTLSAIDISNPAAPEALWEAWSGQIFEDGLYGEFDGVQAMGAYLVCHMGNSLVVLNNNAPNLPTFVTGVNRIISAVVFNGSKAIAARNDWENGITLTHLDLADPAQPVITHQTTRSDIVDFIAQYSHKLYYFGPYVYLVENKQTHQLIHVMDSRSEDFLTQDYITITVSNTESISQLLPVNESDPRLLWLSFDADGENLIQVDATDCGP